MMATMSDWLDLCDRIDDGGYDEGLEEIAKAVSSRRDIVNRRSARRMMRSITVDDKVRLTNGIKPRYLEGMVGTVIEIRSGAAVVKLTKVPTHQGAGRPPAEGYKQKLLVPFENLKRVDDNVADLDDVDMSDSIGDDEDYEGDDDA
jgi:hypothetical protein